MKRSKASLRWLAARSICSGRGGDVVAGAANVIRANQVDVVHYRHLQIRYATRVQNGRENSTASSRLWKKRTYRLAFLAASFSERRRMASMRAAAW